MRLNDRITVETRARLPEATTTVPHPEHAINQAERVAAGSGWCAVRERQKLRPIPRFNLPAR